MKTGFIGIGNMGGAIFDSYASCNRDGADSKRTGEAADHIMICDLDRRACEKKEVEFPQVSMTDSICDLVAASEVVVVGVKPQGMATVMEEVATKYRNDKILISMAAGISIDWIEGFLGEDAKIIRIMPNTPAKVGEAMIALCRGRNISDEDMKKAERVLSPAGVIQQVEEDQIDCVIGVSGSSPAYTYMYIEGLVKAAVANGMDEEQARVFAAQSVLGAARMVLESEESLEQLRINVCSPGGTTIEAVNRLFENGFMDKVVEGFQAAVDRSIEMTREKNEAANEQNEGAGK